MLLSPYSIGDEQGRCRAEAGACGGRGRPERFQEIHACAWVRRLFLLCGLMGCPSPGTKPTPVLFLPVCPHGPDSPWRNGGSFDICFLFPRQVDHTWYFRIRCCGDFLRLGVAVVLLVTSCALIRRRQQEQFLSFSAAQQFESVPDGRISIASSAAAIQPRPRIRRMMRAASCRCSPRSSKKR